MAQILAAAVFFTLALLIMGLGLHFSQWKKKENSCCGGGHCSTDGHHDHECDSANSCYSSKEEFVDNFNKIKIQKIEIDRTN